jgi:hypothetical protein
VLLRLAGRSVDGEPSFVIDGQIAVLEEFGNEDSSSSLGM